MALTVSVVTPVFNGASFIEATISSVLEQTYPHIEYIIMDGGSTDGTAEIARRFADRLTLISEPDEGQSHAINKGWGLSSGDLLGWLCADDLYEPDTVEKAVRALKTSAEAQWVYGTGRSFDAAGRARPFRHPVEQWNYDRLLNVHNYIIQPSVFMRRSVLNQFGLLRTDLHYVMDYEYWLRIGREYPGLFDSNVRVRVKRYAAAKTHSGGQQRLDELIQVMSVYGGHGLPAGYRHEWATTALRSGLAAVGSGRWLQAKQSFTRLGLYPRAVPRGAAKLILETLPAPVDRQLRRWFVHDP